MSLGRRRRRLDEVGLEMRIPVGRMDLRAVDVTCVFCAYMWKSGSFSVSADDNHEDAKLMHEIQHGVGCVQIVDMMIPEL